MQARHFAGVRQPERRFTQERMGASTSTSDREGSWNVWSALESSRLKLLMWLLLPLTFGVGTLAMWLSARNWPAAIDREGITTRAGKRFLWDDFGEQRRVSVVDPRSGRRIAGRLDLVFGHGVVKVVPQSLAEGPAVLACISEGLGEPVNVG